MNPTAAGALRLLSTPVAVAFALLTAATPAWSVGTRSVGDDSYEDFSAGELESVALSSDGFLLPTYARTSIGDTGEAIVWDVLRESGGAYIGATGHRGRLVRVNDNGTTRSLAEVDDPQVTALARLQDGSVLFAGAPSGTLYRLGGDDRVTTAATLDATFVWKMLTDPRGDVWVATGTDGRLFRVRPRGNTFDVQLVAELKSANLLDLWIDEEGRIGRPGDVYVAGQDPGWLYRVAPSGNEVHVVFNAEAEEVRALAPFAEGIALALNTERAPTPQALNLTLRMSGGEVASVSSSSQQNSSNENSRGLEEAFADSRRQYGSPRSQVVVLGREGFARLLWQSPERPIHDLEPSPDGGLFVAAGDDGRLFEITETGEHAVVADVREDYIVRIVPDGNGYLLASARNGLVYRVGERRSAGSVFISRPLDAQVPAAWGSFYLRGDLADGRRVRVAFRAGNDGDPESDFWSPWSEEQTVRPNEPVAMPDGPSRFMQYRLRLQGDGDAPLRIDATELFFMEPNAAPRIARLVVTQPGQGGAAGSQAARRTTAPPAPTSPQGSSGSGSSGSNGSQPAQAADGERDARSNPMVVRVEWQAQDPNNDQLEYALYYRGEEEQAWKLVADELTQTQMSIDVGGVADGHYRFRLVASDAPANAPGAGLTAERISDQITIDNTPPHIKRLTAGVSGRRATIRIEVQDEISILAALKIDIDNGDALPLLPVDGLLDERIESFEWQTGLLEPGEHVATVVATDRLGNSSVKKVVFHVDP